MSDKELFKQKIQAKLDEWKADIDKLKAKASGASADTQLDLNKQIDHLKEKVEEGKAKLSEIIRCKDDTWQSVKGSAESAWESMKSAFHDAKDKFKS